MSATDHCTTMKNVVVIVRDMLDASRASGDIVGVRQVKRGILPVQPIFPCITIVPVSEEVLSYRSSRRAVVGRTIDIHALTFDARGRVGFDQAKTIIESCLDIIRGNQFLVDSDGAKHALSMEFGGIQYNNGKPIDGSGLYNVSLPVTYISRESLPAMGNQPITDMVDNPPTTDVVSAIKNKLYTKKATTLSNIRVIDSEEWGPNAVWPRILIRPTDEVQSHDIRGIDVVTNILELDIESQVGSAKDTAMDFHLDLLEPVKDALQEEGNWMGTSYFSALEQTVFDVYRMGGKPIYRTTVTITIKSHHAQGG